MNSKAQLTADTIAKVAEGKIDIVNAAKLLNKSRRTIERYLQRYRDIGIQFVIHPLKTQALIKKKYFDLNLTLLGEMLEANEGIRVKRETLRNWAHKIHHLKRAKRRRSQVRKRRERMESPGLLMQMDGSKSPGLLMQMDGSTHRWFGVRSPA